MPQFRLIAASLLALSLFACAPVPPAAGPSPAPSASQPGPGASAGPSAAPTTNPGPAAPEPGSLSLSRISTLAGAREVVAKSKDGTLSEARFYEPAGVVRDAAGVIYVAESANHSIRKITPQGVSTLAGTGKPGYKDGPAGQAQFQEPRDLILDAQGNLYISDAGNHRIRKITPDGTVSTVAGSGKNEFKNGPALSAGFFYPTGLDRDAQGNFYVADSTNNAVRKITPDGEVTTLAGAADGSGEFRDGKGAAAAFRRPSDVLVTPRGIYVADNGNHAIRLIETDGTVKTVAGAGLRSQGAEDGLGAAARLNGPMSLASDRAGNLYFAEFNGDAVRRMTPAGLVTTLIHGLPSGFVDGPLTQGKVHAPTGIFCDGQALYLADRDNHSIRKID